jgi:hypothetical protein
MTHIQITDGNSSDLGLSEELANEELTNEELTDEELSAIDGGVLGAGTSILKDTVSGNPIDWGSAVAGGLGGAGTGAAGGLWGGVLGASLAGED